MEHAERFRKGQFLTDAIIRVDNTDFIVHKIILASKSLYFERLFTESQKQVYEIEGSLTPEIFDLILAHIYGQPLPRMEWEAYIHLIGEMLALEIRNDHPETLLRLVKITPEMFADYMKIVTVSFDTKIPSNYVKYIAGSLDYTFDLSELDDELIRRLLLSKGFIVRNLIRLYQMIKGLVDSGHDPDLYNIINYKLFPLEIYLHFPQSFLQSYDNIGTVPQLWKPNDRFSDDEITLLAHDSENAMDSTGRIWKVKGITEAEFQFCDVITLCHCSVNSDENTIEYVLCFYF